MRAALLWISLLAASAAGAQEEPRAVLLACAKQADVAAIGLPALEKACPSLQRSLESLGVRSLLTPSSRQRLGRESLPRVLDLLRPARSTPPGRASLAAGLEPEEAAAPQSWWQRLKAWAMRLLPVPEGNPSGGWLSRWLARLTPGEVVARVTFYALIAALVLGACVIVVNELRAAGLLAPRRRAPRPPTMPALAPGDGVLTLERVRAAAAAERPALLFRLVVAALISAGRAPADRSLTHRELTQRVQLADAGERGAWGRLADLAERQLYSATPATALQRDAVITEAERLYVSLQHAPVTPS